MRKLVLLLALLSAGGAAFAQGTSASFALSELRTASGAVLARRLFGALAPDMFVQPARGIGTANAYRHGAQVWAWTRPVAEIPGLCRTDRLILDFRAAAGGRRGDPRMRLRGVNGRTHYIVTDRARLDAGGNLPPGEEAACRAVDPLGTDRLFADNSMQLREALQLLDALRAGRLSAPLDCASEGCREAVTALGSAALRGVAHCQVEPGANACLRIETPDWTVAFLLDGARRAVHVRAEAVDNIVAD